MNSCRISRAFLAGAGQEIDRIFPFLEGEIGLADIIVQRLHEFLQQEFRPRVWRVLKAADHGGGQFGFVELGHFVCPAEVRNGVTSLHHGSARGKRRAVGTGGHFSAIKDLPRQPEISPMLAPTPASPESAGMSKAALDRLEDASEAALHRCRPLSGDPASGLPPRQDRAFDRPGLCRRRAQGRRSRTTPSSASIR